MLVKKGAINKIRLHRGVWKRQLFYEAPDAEQRDFRVKYLITSSSETNYRSGTVFISEQRLISRITNVLVSLLLITSFTEEKWVRFNKLQSD